MENIHSCSDICEVPECVESRAKKLPILENWRIINYGNLSVAEGNVYNSSRFGNGLYITTSWLKAYSLSEGKVTTNNRVYKLGKPAIPPLAECDVILKKEDK